MSSETPNGTVSEYRGGSEIVQPGATGEADIETGPPPTEIQYSDTNRPTPQTVAQYAVDNNVKPKDALRVLCNIKDINSGWCRALIRSAYKIIRADISKPIDASGASLSEQYVILRESLYRRAQEGDTRAIVDWCALTEHERAPESEDVSLVEDAKAALKGMAREYAATLPTSCCANAINELVARVCKGT